MIHEHVICSKYKCFPNIWQVKPCKVYMTGISSYWSLQQHRCSQIVYHLLIKINLCFYMQLFIEMSSRTSPSQGFKRRKKNENGMHSYRIYLLTIYMSVFNCILNQRGMLLSMKRIFFTENQHFNLMDVFAQNQNYCKNADSVKVDI